MKWGPFLQSTECKGLMSAVSESNPSITKVARPLRDSRRSAPPGTRPGKETPQRGGTSNATEEGQRRPTVLRAGTPLAASGRSLSDVLAVLDPPEAGKTPPGSRMGRSTKTESRKTGGTFRDRLNKPYSSR